MVDFEKVFCECEVYVYYVDMPYSANGCIVENTDGGYTIYLNSRMTAENNYKCFLHELNHIKRQDFSTTSNIHDIENNNRKS